MYKATIGDKTLEINLTKEKVLVDGKEIDFNSIETSNGYFHILSNNQSFNAEVVSVNKETKEV